jgi:hypothetical protein
MSWALDESAANRLKAELCHGFELLMISCYEMLQRFFAQVSKTDVQEVVTLFRVFTINYIIKAGKSTLDNIRSKQSASSESSAVEKDFLITRKPLFEFISGNLEAFISFLEKNNLLACRNYFWHNQFHQLECCFSLNLFGMNKL